MSQQKSIDKLNSIYPNLDWQDNDIVGMIANLSQSHYVVVSPSGNIVLCDNDADWTYDVKSGTPIEIRDDILITILSV